MGWQEEVRQKVLFKARQNLQEAEKEVRSIILSYLSAGMHPSGDDYSDYSRSHGRRREKAGLQTADKDLEFSGTMLNNLKTRYNVKGGAIQASIDFEGKAHRRDDQRDAPDNKDIAVWFEEREGRKILSLTEQQKKDIYEKYGVEVHD